MIEVKDRKPDREDLVNAVLKALTTLQSEFPEQEICIDDSNETRLKCRLGDALIFEGWDSSGPVIVIDSWK